MTAPGAGRRGDGPRILVVTRQLANPPRSGIMLREIHLVRALSALGPTAVFGLAPAGGPPEEVELAGWWASSDPGACESLRGDQLKQAIRRGESPFTLPRSAVAAAELERVLTEFAPDVVVLRGTELGSYLPVVRRVPRAVVLDAETALASAMHRMGELDPNRARGMTWRHASGLVAPAERAAVEAVDQVWVSSELEGRILVEMFPSSAPVRVLPNVVDVDSYTPSTPGRPDSTHLLYTGRFDFWPNDQAAAELVHEILPRLPGACLSLVGIAPTAWMQALTVPGVEVTGAVDDVRPYLAAASCLVVPLRAGTGTRLKVLEAGAARVPVVSTALGVEGIAFAPGVHYLRAETAADFAAAVERLNDDAALAFRLTDAAHRIVTDRYSLATLTEQTAAALRAV